MEQERIHEIREEKRASDALREAGVLIDAGDHRPAGEILRALLAMGVIATNQIYRYWRFGRRRTIIMI